LKAENVCEAENYDFKETFSEPPTCAFSGAFLFPSIFAILVRTVVRFYKGAQNLHKFLGILILKYDGEMKVI